jgi:tetratricopeptide (TPR) repeat protein
LLARQQLVGACLQRAVSAGTTLAIYRNGFASQALGTGAAENAGMARTPPQYAQLLDEPSIIIDPSLYLPPPRTPIGVARDVCFGLARGLMVAMLAGATVFSVAHVLKHQTLTHGLVQHREEALIMHVQAARADAADVARAEAPRPQASAMELTSAVAPSAGRPVERVTNAPAMAAAPGLYEERLDQRAEPTVEVEVAPAAEATNADLMSEVRAARRLLKQRRFDEAEAAFRAVLEQRSVHPAALSGLARVQLARGRFDDALHFAERAVRSAPYHGAYHLVLGDALRANGDVTSAQTEYALAKELTPNSKVDEAERVLPANPFL